MKQWALLLGTIPALVMTAPNPAGAVIHEIVAAYCSGGGVGVIGDAGFLRPPGISDRTKPNFAQPVNASGAVTATSPPLTTDKSNVKFPENLAAPTLQVANADHPSAAHCAKLPD